MAALAAALKLTGDNAFWSADIEAYRQAAQCMAGYHGTGRGGSLFGLWGFGQGCSLVCVQNNPLRNAAFPHGGCDGYAGSDGAQCVLTSECIAHLKVHRGFLGRKGVWCS